jgi:hypothetical protein
VTWLLAILAVIIWLWVVTDNPEAVLEKFVAKFVEIVTKPWKWRNAMHRRPMGPGTLPPKPMSIVAESRRRAPRIPTTLSPITAEEIHDQILADMVRDTDAAIARIDAELCHG